MFKVAQDFDLAIQLIKDSLKKGRAVALSGAGMSAESGIATFRGKGGLWEKYDPNIFAYPEGLMQVFQKQPQEIVNFLDDLYSVLLIAQPNPGHLSLAKMENLGLLNAVITQNIDNLHTLAGNKKVLELHGCAWRIRCMGCGRKKLLDKGTLRKIIAELKNTRTRIGILKLFSQFFPKCSCGMRFRIDIVLFSEALPQDVLTESYRQLDKASLLFLVGTSGVVYPAAGLPIYAKQRGAKIVQINSEKTELSAICDAELLGRAGEILPSILERL